MSNLITSVASVMLELECICDVLHVIKGANVEGYSAYLYHPFFCSAFGSSVAHMSDVWFVGTVDLHNVLVILQHCINC